MDDYIPLQLAHEPDYEMFGSEGEPEDDEDEGRLPIPCCKCGNLTTWDPTYQDLCYRCIRASNE